MTIKRCAYLAIFTLALAGCGSESDGEKRGWQGGLYDIWMPDANANGRVIILHQGHAPFAYQEGNLVPVAEQFRAAGYIVYGVEMPWPSPHDSGPLSKFTQPVTEILDALDGQGFDIYMVGLSGGGWTTTIMTYLDTRIIKGYSVAGDHPVKSLAGDWESRNPPAAYLTMYTAAGTRLLHIYNYYDPCCFSGLGGVDGINGIDGNQGYTYVMDTTHREHQISPWAVSHILADIGP